MKKKSYYFGDKALIRRQASRGGVGDNREDAPSFHRAPRLNGVENWDG